MSTDYWVIQGVGIDTDDIVFSNEKLKQMIMERPPYNKALAKKLHRGEFDIDDYLYGSYFENIADLLTFCDDTDTLTYGADGDKSYFYYPPLMPWELSRNDPSDIEGVYENIINAVQKVSDMTADEIKALIRDDLYVVSCG